MKNKTKKSSGFINDMIDAIMNGWALLEVTKDGITHISKDGIIWKVKEKGDS